MVGRRQCLRWLLLGALFSLLRCLAAAAGDSAPDQNLDFASADYDLSHTGQDSYDYTPDLSEEDLQDAENRLRYGFGVARRSPSYSFGLGKRQSTYAFGLGKRAPSYAFGLGKRAPYGFGLGKRAPYGFGLGKRASQGLGLEKRQTYGFGLGKRNWSTWFGGPSRDVLKRPSYGFGLGKRSVPEGSYPGENSHFASGGTPKSNEFLSAR